MLAERIIKTPHGEVHYWISEDLNAAHNSNDDDPEAVNKAIESFLISKCS